jgi:hypothetical protein
VQKSIDVADNADLFAGVLYKLPDLAQLEPALGTELNQLEQRITSIRQKADLAKPSDLVPDLTQAAKQLQQIQTRATNEHVKFLLQQKEGDFQEATRLSAGLVLDVLASDETVVPGQEFNVTVSVVNGGPYTYSSAAVNFELPSGWQATFAPPPEPGQGGRGARGGGARGGGGRGGGAAVSSPPGAIAPGQKYDQVYTIKVPQNATFTQPYWLREARKTDRFVWPAGSPANMPFDPPLLNTHVRMSYQDTTIALEHAAQFPVQRSHVRRTARAGEGCPRSFRPNDPGHRCDSYWRRPPKGIHRRDRKPEHDGH